MKLRAVLLFNDAAPISLSNEGRIDELAEKLEETLLELPSQDIPYSLSLSVDMGVGDKFFAPAVAGLCNSKVAEVMGPVAMMTGERRMNLASKAEVFEFHYDFK